MRQATLIFLGFITNTIYGFTIRDPPPTFCGEKYVSNPPDICAVRSFNGKTNGLSQNWFYRFADTCKNAIYDGRDAEDKQQDTGSYAKSFRYDSENWAARFVYIPAECGDIAGCRSLTIRCSDLVGKDADGKYDTSRFGLNIQDCYPNTDDKVYHGGESHVWVSTGTRPDGNKTYAAAATVKIWRCRDGECGKEHDDANDPQKLTKAEDAFRYRPTKGYDEDD